MFFACLPILFFHTRTKHTPHTSHDMCELLLCHFFFLGVALWALLCCEQYAVTHTHAGTKTRRTPTRHTVPRIQFSTHKTRESAQVSELITLEKKPLRKKRISGDATLCLDDWSPGGIQRFFLMNPSQKKGSQCEKGVEKVFSRDSCTKAK